MKLADKIRQLNTERGDRRNIDDLSNDELIELISMAADDWLDHGDRRYNASSVDRDWDN